MTPKGHATRLMVLAVAACCLTPTLAGEPPKPRWEPAYKIKPHESGRLTAADVVGPDGIVYPDWRYAGVPGGITSVPQKAHVEQFGGVADDNRDDSDAIAAGARAVAEAGGGALVLAAGTYHLDRPVILRDDGVVIRGQGAEKTKIVFRYGPPPSGLAFFTPGDAETVGPDTPIEVHAQPDDLERIAIESGGKTIAEKTKSQHWGGTYSLRIFGDSILGRLKAGEHRLSAVAQWSGGRRAEAVIDVRLDPAERLAAGQRRLPSAGLAALMFAGQGRGGPEWQLAEDGRRGQREIVLTSAPDLEPGDAVRLDAPATPRWNELVQNACQWGSYRANQFRVEAVRGNRVELNQPLRIDFPAVDRSTLRKIDPIRRCGVEELAIEQTEKLWTCGVLFQEAWECWARGLHVTKAGRHPVYTRQAKWCEIRDCRFDDAWYQGGGGTAYVGWEHSYDCLMENVTTLRMRHAPCVQWSSSGNVIRNSVFHGSDAQWHAGWTNENLFELCTVDAEGSWGSYGHGGWASPPEDAAHGPEGPRNVVYNCDLRGTKTGLWLGGMNENWLILYNRIRSGSGSGIYARNHSFDHVIRGNAIAVPKSDQPAIELATPDCTGVEILENRIYGAGGRLVGGAGSPLVDDGNALFPYRDDAPRPDPAVRSIFEWQRQQPRR